MNKSSSLRLFFNIITSSSGRRMSTKKKTPSHYETLEVNSRATQGEIKSAYFKLSKQYHPDKNKSDEASEKFRDISEAYEVLGNFNSRKVYDRSLIVKPRSERDCAKSSRLDPKMKYYQTQAAIFKHESKSGSTPVYDFDAWTKAHYGQTLRRNIQDKKDSRRLRELRKHFESEPLDRGSPDQTILLVSFFLFAALIMLSIRGPHNQNFYHVQRQKERFAESNDSSVESPLASSTSSDWRFYKISDATTRHFESFASHRGESLLISTRLVNVWYKLDKVIDGNL